MTPEPSLDIAEQKTPVLTDLETWNGVILRQLINC